MLDGRMAFHWVMKRRLSVATKQRHLLALAHTVGKVHRKLRESLFYGKIDNWVHLVVSNRTALKL